MLQIRLDKLEIDIDGFSNEYVAYLVFLFAAEGEEPREFHQRVRFYSNDPGEFEVKLKEAIEQIIPHVFNCVNFEGRVMTIQVGTNDIDDIEDIEGE